MPVKPRKIPMRMCVGCREMKPKASLLRVVKPQDGDAHIDFGGRAPGRGAYVCPDSACLEKARKSKVLERTLEASIEPAVYEQLAKELDARVQ